ncbi:MAG: hypothetical protein CMK59_07165 [Proteobacteria bacterium]|nr:hypothetical protein [Pseudomonadota bacterium]
MAWADCDDGDAGIGSNITDADCDGVQASQDCNDQDPTDADATDDCDQDGVLVGVDCDDTNADIGLSGTGATEDCAGESCLEILNNGYSVGTGLYYIDPLNSTPYQVRCDMDTDGGGWTVVANNDSSDTEASGCFTRVSGYSSDICGSVSHDQDFTVNAAGIPFSGMVFAAYSGVFEMQAYQYFTWNSDQELPTSETWSLQADNYNQTLSDYSSLDKIYCTYSGVNRLEYVRLQYTLTGIVSRNTVFSAASTSYEMSFTDYEPFTNGQTQGLDDWQDGDGCGDEWTPSSQRGASTFVMIR